ncbi:MAG TPA: ABC transporter permease subunit [Candidatus Saccharimonadales bacterium]|nr:ABC transporter permease subunit [Candidatus Saccharimonadales bacterium]
MHADVLRRELADHQRAIAAWGIGAVLLTSLYILFYPTVHDSGAGIQAIFDTMPRAFRDAFLGTGVDFLSPNGYLGTELFSILVPALMLVMGILTGSRALAGEEQNGTIDLLLATPIRRRRLVTEKAVGAQLPLFVMAAFVWLAVALIGPSQGLSVNLGVLAIALIAVALLAAGFGMLAFLVAGATGSTALGGGVAAALAVLMYVLNVFGSLVSSLTGFANTVSPFHWVGGAGVLATGVAWPGMMALVVCPIVLLGVAIMLYERRDLAA